MSGAAQEGWAARAAFDAAWAHSDWSVLAARDALYDEAREAYRAWRASEPFPWRRSRSRAASRAAERYLRLEARWGMWRLLMAGIAAKERFERSAKRARVARFAGALEK